MKSKIIAVDFDGTLCENKWPEIGEPNNEVIKYLKTEQQNEARLILWTCRTGDKLTDAINWCADHGLNFDAVDQNVKEAIEEFGEDTRKVFANEYIDDRMCNRFKFPFNFREKQVPYLLKFDASHYYYKCPTIIKIKKEIDGYLVDLLGKQAKKELLSSLYHGKTIIISGNYCTGKTTLVSVLKYLGYNAVEADNVYKLELTKPIESKVRNLDAELLNSTLEETTNAKN